MIERIPKPRTETKAERLARQQAERESLESRELTTPETPATTPETDTDDTENPTNPADIHEEVASARPEVETTIGDTGEEARGDAEQDTTETSGAAPDTSTAHETPSVITVDKMTEIKERRKTTRKDLTERFGRPQEVPGTKGNMWASEDGSVYVIRGDGEPLQLAAGESHNFGNRSEPAWKKWSGDPAVGWTDAEAPSIARERRKKGGGVTSRQMEDIEDRNPAGNEPEDAVLSRRRKEKEGTMNEPSMASDEGIIATKEAPTDSGHSTRQGVEVRNGKLSSIGGGGGKTNSNDGALGENRRVGVEVVNGVLRTTQSSDESTEKGPLSSGKHGGGERPPSGGGGGDKEPPSGTAGKIFEAGKDGGHESAGSPRSWDIDPVRYVGIRPKPLKDILSNKQDQQLYGELLNSLAPGQTDLFARAATGTLDAQESKIILYAQYEMTRRLKEATEVANKITQSDVELIMKRNESFHQIAMLHGPETTVDMLRTELPSMAMRDETSVSTLVQAYSDLSDDRRTVRYKLWDAQIRNWCKKRGINEHDVAAFDTEEGRQEMKRKLTKQYRDEAGQFVRIVDSAFISTFAKIGFRSSFENRAEETIDQARRFNAPASPIKKRWWLPEFIRERIPRSPTASALQDVDKNLATITQVLAATVSEDDFRRRITIEAVTGQKQQNPRETGPKSFGEVRDPAEKLSPKDFQKWFDRDKAHYAESIGRPLEELTEDELTEFRDTKWNPPEIQRAQEQQSEGSGFWASVFRALFGGHVNEQKKKVKVV